MNSFFGKAGIVGLERAVDVLDTLGSSMTNMHAGSGFAYNLASRGNKVSILAFEVANTIAKGSNLLQSISEENIRILRDEILQSDGVLRLVSTDMTELLRIAAIDQREEFNIFSREVIRFGDLCKDPQWHNLDRYFSKFDSDPGVGKLRREEAEMTMQELLSLAQYTSELYHELHALDRFEQDYQRKVEEVESLHLPRKGEGLLILHSELKQQKKLVKSLKKKSLWSRSLVEVVEKLVDIVTFIHQNILEVFGDNVLGLSSSEEKASGKPDERLGIAGLALHYAHIVTQIDNIASRPTSLPPNMRDGLYSGLPINVKKTLRSRLLSLDVHEELSIPQMKTQMERTLKWLAPIAADTTKAHQGFGWVGEWANTGIEFGKTTKNSVIRLQTLYHADKGKMDRYILELVICLHRLISLVKYKDSGSKAQPVQSPIKKELVPDHETHSEVQKNTITLEAGNVTDNTMKRRKLLGKSKSLEFVMERRKSHKVRASSRSAGSSPRRALERRQSKSSILDVLDGIDQHTELSSI
ncbi:protein PSK SIMULATOR 2-like isoform X2 [Apium graveolens]